MVRKHCLFQLPISDRIAHFGHVVPPLHVESPSCYSSRCIAVPGQVSWLSSGVTGIRLTHCIAMSYFDESLTKSPQVVASVWSPSQLSLGVPRQQPVRTATLSMTGLMFSYRGL